MFRTTTGDMMTGPGDRRIRQAQTPFMPDEIPYPLRGADHGPLAGLTVAVKDMYSIAGTRTGGGNPTWRDAHPPAAENAGVVRRILDAGGAIVGKTICDEFFYSISGENAHYGAPRNPRAPGRIPGGSSSGSASAVASGACDIAIGSDTGGSVRVPAALCGLYGLRVTQGRFDFTGAMEMAPSFDTGGWFASGPGTFRRAGDALLIGDRGDGRVEQVVVLDDALAEADGALADCVTAALAAAGDLLPSIGHGRAADEGLDTWREAMRIVQAYEVWQVYGEFITSQHPELGPGIAERMAAASRVTAAAADREREVLRSAIEQLDRLTPVGTVLMMPTTPVVAPRLNADSESIESFRTRGMRLNCIASISGLPQVTISVGLIDDLPVGVSFVGWRGGDEALLDLAVRLSRLAGSIG